jgi:serine/threonine-protein kinase
MAEVFLATRPNPVSFVALKRVRPEIANDPSFIRMFLDEARITKCLSHPNITKLLDFGIHDGSPYLVVEYIMGVNAVSLIRHGPMPPAVVAEVGWRVALALHSAHEQVDELGDPLGIVHRDVTPHNIMIDFEGRVKLLDFGIALARVRAERTRTGVLKGKWPYLSPEQIHGNDQDRRSDVFSLGSVLFEMLSGKRAFTAGSPVATLQMILRDHPPPLMELAPHTPRQLADVVEVCLRKNRDDRFPTALALAHALDGVRVAINAVRRQESAGQYVSRTCASLKESLSQVMTHIVQHETSSAPSAAVDWEAQTLVRGVLSEPFEQRAADYDAGDGGPPDPGGPLLPLSDSPGARSSPPVSSGPSSPTAVSPPATNALSVLVGVIAGLALALALWWLTNQ